MAYYSYKHVRDLIPDSFRDKFILEFEEEFGREFDYDSNYDGDMWLLTASYIEHLLLTISSLKDETSVN